ncbi:protein SIEVE ELEMENT OCCLUSION B-like isoform X2 [Corylus avellana]|uniref:protein SIEVE ELEMENT OCCLUSION B-like isoform X2 n=1 Tax=Corylus avellana TaxID=13451 RepID=UPI00286A17C4|nr:protein SIEVE ELEMENT OCCLUSION B-like isoform X2 [Corylus avellana]
MDTKLGASAAGNLQQPNVTSSAQQPSRGTNALQQPTGQVGALQQASQLGQLGALPQPSSQLGSNYQPSSQLGANYQPSSQLGSNYQPSSQLGSYQQSSQPVSLQQQPTQLGSYQPSSQLGSLQQPTGQLVSYQQPISQQLGALQMGSFQQPGKMSPFSMQQLIKSDRGNMLTLSDDNWMVKQIQAAHTPDGRVVEIGPLLSLVEDILNRATLPAALITTGAQSQIDSLEQKTYQTNFLALLDALSFTIDRISREISYRTMGGTDAHQTTLSIFQQLSLYDWDAKLVLTLAAFALHYGEFWLLAQIYTTNQLAKSMALLRQVPGLIERANSLKPRFDALNDLIKAILEVTHCVVKFKELPSMYITPDVPALATGIAHIPTAVYWTIRSIVACATQITSFTSMGYEFAISATEAHWELSTLAHNLRNMRDHLNTQLEKCHQHINEKLDGESYDMLVKLFEMIHLDNMKVLKALICPRDDVQPLVDGSTKRRVNIDVLRRKNVLLLISGLNISQDELSILEQIYNESRLHPTRLESQYELVWIPIVDPSSQLTDPIQNKFESLQSSMPWYTVQHPSLIGKAAVRFIKEKWHLRNKPILVVLDPLGKVVSPNAIHMMWIWVSNAFPFTSTREEALWREETWRLELLVDSLDQTILNWIREGKYIFLYGGDDIEWIRKFTNSVRTVATAANIPLEMFYVGKGSKKEQVQRVIRTIALEKLSSYWQDPTLIWFFWTRLESMLFSKIQLDKADDHMDPVMQGIKRLLSYDREGGWAVLSKGSSIVVNGHGNTVATTLVEYEMWKANVPLQGFDVAFKNHHDLRHGEKYPCCRFEFSHNAGRIPLSMRCPQCHHNMEEFTTFLCCHEEDVPAIMY